MILNTVKTQCGEDVPSHEVYLTCKKLWVEDTLSCHSSRFMEMGTCLCVNHPTWESRIIPREEVKRLIDGNIVSLTDDERDDLLNVTFEKKVIESFALKGFSIEEVENWCKDCCNLDMNPLPVLSRIVPYAEVKFAYDNGGTFIMKSEYEKGILYVAAYKAEDHVEKVTIALSPPKNEKLLDSII